MRSDREYGDDVARKTLLEVFEMLGREPVDQRRGFGEVGHEDDRAIGIPARPCGFAGGKRVEQALDGKGAHAFDNAE